MNGKAVKIALAVSLTVNVFVVGAVVGALGAQARYEARRQRPMGNPLMMAGAGLPEALRDDYMKRLREQGREARPSLTAAMQARMEAARLMSQPDFDPAAVTEALSRARQAEVTARASLEDTVVEFASELDPEQRRVLAQALRQPPGEGRGRGGPGFGRGKGYPGRPGGPGRGGEGQPPLGPPGPETEN